MKIFTNLPGNLRALFGFLRIVAVLMAAFWLLLLTFNTWIQNRFTDNPNIVVTVGEMALPVGPEAIHLKSDSASAGIMTIHSLRGTLQVNLASKDPALVTAICWTIIPAVAVFSVFGYLLFTALRNLCAKIEAGEVFSDANLRLVRNIGWIIIGYSVATFVVQLTGSLAMGSYFSQHVTMSGIEGTVSFPRGVSVGKWNFSGAPFPGNLGLVTGCLVLMLTEAFRQGLKLKQETDLTV